MAPPGKIGLKVLFGSHIRRGIIAAYNSANPTKMETSVPWINIREERGTATLIYYESREQYALYNDRIVGGLVKELGKTSVGVIRAYIHQSTHLDHLDK